ncbi:MAG: hypothetical protein ABI685_01670 [Ferruginibacter sp.]
MRKFHILLILGITFSTGRLYAQATLPDFTLKNTNGEISVFWLNQYPKQVNGISVQRSYDSTKNFTSIASVFNPQNTVNGFTDMNPPYNKMYYRLFIGFDTGVFILTESKRPEVNSKIDYTALIIEINTLYEKNILLQEQKLKAKKAAALALAAKQPVAGKGKAVTKAKTKAPPPVEVVEPEIIDEIITYPSKRVFTDNDNNIVIKLPNIKKTNYRIKFYTEDYKPLFELNNLLDDSMVVEKVNFTHAGWFMFEIFRNGLLFEENKFYISKDEKKPGK